MVQINPNHGRSGDDGKPQTPKASSDAGEWCVLHIDVESCGGDALVQEVVRCMNLMGLCRPFHWDGETQSCKPYSDAEMDKIRLDALNDAIDAMQDILQGKDDAEEEEPPKARRVEPCGRAMLIEMSEGMNPEVPECLLPSMMWRAAVATLNHTVAGNPEDTLKSALIEEASRRMQVTRPQSAMQVAALLCEVCLHMSHSLRMREIVLNGIGSMLKSIIKQGGEQ